jgi:hypothetical protein
MTGKHPKTTGRHVDGDLKRDPGIGSSKGTFATGEDPRSIRADNTVEGDVGNETTREGGVDPRHRGRTNK